MAWTDAHAGLLKHLGRRDAMPLEHLPHVLLDVGADGAGRAEEIVNELLAAGLAEIVEGGLVRTSQASVRDTAFPTEVARTWTLAPADWEGAVAAEHERRVAALRSRIEIVDGLRRGLDLGDELHAVVRRCADRGDARSALLDLGFAEIVAEHLLDMRVSEQTALARVHLDHEAVKLREELERLSPPGREGGRRT